MKKILMIMLLSFVGLFASAESVWFKAYNYAIKYKTEYNRNNSFFKAGFSRSSTPFFNKSKFINLRFTYTIKVL